MLGERQSIIQRVSGEHLRDFVRHGDGQDANIAVLRLRKGKKRQAVAE
jgi:hypothetical protein